MNDMNLLDENLVDQEQVEVRFRLMLDEMYERLMDGTLDVESLEKNPLSEYEICGINWRFINWWGMRTSGVYILDSIDTVVRLVRIEREKYEGCTECDKFLDKEYVKEFSGKMLDLYWDKEIWGDYVLEWKIGDQWKDTHTSVPIRTLLTRKKYDISEMFNAMERFITPDDKELLDWIHKWYK